MKKSIAILVTVCLTFASFAESYFTGDGGKSLSIEISTPNLTNIDDNSWLPDLVMNTLATDIEKYSAISVFKTWNLEYMQESQSRAEMLGKDVPIGQSDVAENVLHVTIIQKPSAYSFSCVVDSKKKNTQIASYNNPNCSAQDIESCKVLKEATADFLAQLGVELTKEGKESLLDIGSAAAVKIIEGQQNLAKSDAALRHGRTVEALSYYQKYIPTADKDNLARTQAKLQQLSSTIAGGDFGVAVVEDKIRFKKQFMEYMQQTVDFLEENPPFVYAYLPSTLQSLPLTTENYENGTMDFVLQGTLLLNGNEKMITDIQLALQQIEESKKWSEKISAFPNGWGKGIFKNNYNKIEVTISLCNQEGVVLSTVKQSFWIEDFQKKGYTVERITDNGIVSIKPYFSCPYPELSNSQRLILFRNIPVSTAKDIEKFNIKIDSIVLETNPLDISIINADVTKPISYYIVSECIKNNPHMSDTIYYQNDFMLDPESYKVYIQPFDKVVKDSDNPDIIKAVNLDGVDYYPFSIKQGPKGNRFDTVGFERKRDKSDGFLGMYKDTYDNFATSKSEGGSVSGHTEKHKCMTLISNSPLDKALRDTRLCGKAEKGLFKKGYKTVISYATVSAFVYQSISDFFDAYRHGYSDSFNKGEFLTPGETILFYDYPVKVISRDEGFKLWLKDKGEDLTKLSESKLKKLRKQFDENVI